MTRHSHAAADRKVPQLEEMQANTPQAVVRYSRPTKRQIQTPEIRQTERQDLRCGIRERAAETQVQHLQRTAATYDPDDRLVREVCAVGKDELAQVCELMRAPGVEAVIADTGTSCKVQRLETVGGMSGNVRHASILDMLAIAEGEMLELACADDRAGRWG